MIAKIFKSGNSLALRLPKELEPREGEVSIVREGDRWIVEPLKPDTWPEGFFDKIRIKDPRFKRHPQGESREIVL